MKIRPDGRDRPVAAYPLVLTKLAFPLDPEPHVVRERVLGLLEEAWKHRITVVCAGAGYGKSTVLSDFCRLRAAAERAVWYSLDPEDADPGTFLTHLGVSLSRRIPELVEPLLSMEALTSSCAALAGEVTGAAASRTQLSEWRPALSLIVNAALECLRRDIVVVLDDYHVIPESHFLHQMLSYLIEHLPPQVHLMISSRREPPLALGRTRALGQLLEIGEDDLRVDAEETAAVLSAALAAEPPREVLREVVSRSDGWITGIALAARAVARRKRGDWGFLLERSRRHAYDFLLEQVDAAESEENRGVLREIAVFEYVYPELMDHYLRRDDAAAFLAQLAGRNLFLRRLEGPRQAYRLHSLFRRALLMDLAASDGAAAVRELRRRAGESLGLLGQWDQAAPHFLAAREWERAVTAIDLAAPGLLASGGIKTCWRWLEELPELENVMLACVAELNRARILRIWGRVAEAASALGRAESVASAVVARQGPDQPAQALQARLLLEKAELAFLHGGYQEVGRLAGETLELLAAGEIGDKPLLAHAHALSGTCLAYTGAMDESLFHFRKSEVLYHDVGDVAAEAEMIARAAVSIYEVRGAFREGITELQKAARLVRRPSALSGAGGKLRSGVDTSRIDYYLGAFYADCGENERAMAYFRRALEGARRSDRRPNEALVRAKMGFVHIQLGEWKEALGEFREARTLLGETKESFRLANVYYGLSLLYRLIGDHERALEYARQDLEAVAATGNELFVAQARVNVAAVLVGSGRSTEAVRELAAAEPVLRRWQAKSDLTFLRLVEARAVQVADARWVDRAALPAGVQKPLEEALRLTQEWGYDSIWRRERAMAAPLLKSYLAQKPADALVRPLLRAVEEARGEGEPLQPVDSERPKVLDGPAASEEWPEVKAGLSAFLFGGFEVWLGSRRLDTEQWRQRVADIFQYLALACGRWVPTDQLLEAFWPAMEPREGRRNLTVNVYYLRRTLEPGLVRGEDSLYVQSRRDSYRLASEGKAWTDVGEFLDLWERLRSAQWGGGVPGGLPGDAGGRDIPARALDVGRRLVMLYRGELLAENPYDEWAVQARNETKQAYLSTLSLLAESAHHQGRLEEACRWSQALVAADPGREEAHRLLISCLYGLGQSERALRQFHECRRALEAEFGVGPMPETMRLYQTILDESPSTAVAR